MGKEFFKQHDKIVNGERKEMSASGKITLIHDRIAIVMRKMMYPGEDLNNASQLSQKEIPKADPSAHEEDIPMSSSGKITYIHDRLAIVTRKMMYPGEDMNNASQLSQKEIPERDRSAHEEDIPPMSASGKIPYITHRIAT